MSMLNSLLCYLQLFRSRCRALRWPRQAEEWEGCSGWRGRSRYADKIETGGGRDGVQMCDGRLSNERNRKQRTPKPTFFFLLYLSTEPKEPKPRISHGRGMLKSYHHHAIIMMLSSWHDYPWDADDVITCFWPPDKSALFSPTSVS